MTTTPAALPGAPLYDDVADGPPAGRAVWLTAEDGLRLRLVHWPLAQAKGTVLMFTGRTEYAEKYGRAAADLAARGYAMVTLDWRGQGLSDRVAGDPALGHIPHFSHYARDVRALMAALPQIGVSGPLFLLAHSMGGAIGLRALLDGLPVKAAAFTAPMWGIRLSSSLRPAAWTIAWAAHQLGLSERLVPGARSESYVLWEDFAANLLTHDAEMYGYMKAQATAHPDLVIGGPTLGWVLSGLRETRALLGRASPDLPCLTLLGRDEEIVSTERIEERMARWPGGELLWVEHTRHEVMMEGAETRALAFDRIAAFYDAQPGNAQS